MLDYIVPIIVASVMANNFTSSTPELSTPLPQTTYKDSYTIEVVGQAGARVFVNGVEVAILKSNGKNYIELNTSGAYGSTSEFEIILKNNNNLETQALNISIDKAKAETSRLQAIKLLRQASYTSCETQIDEIMLYGEDAWIDKQLNTISAHDDLTDDYYGYLESVVRIQIRDKPQYFKPEILQDLTTMYPESVSLHAHTMKTFYDRVLLDKIFESEDQLRHRMALALSQIVVVSTNATAGIALAWKGEGVIKLYDDLYKHSFGNYRDVLKSACVSSAMSYYLTFHGNKKEDSVTNTAPDENFARELMQLFSIGIYELNLDGSKVLDANNNPIPSYTQDDVSQLGACRINPSQTHN
ncbi:MAG: DUF1800 family protein [Campylobacterota bacterium]|nr:DUF1800 family protein [Campylobacterota bacterium]